MLLCATSRGCRGRQQLTAEVRVYLVDKLGKRHGSCVQGELQLCSAAHHAIHGGLVGLQGLDQKAVAHRTLHEEAGLHSMYAVVLCAEGVLLEFSKILGFWERTDCTIGCWYGVTEHTAGCGSIIITCAEQPCGKRMGICLSAAG